MKSAIYSIAKNNSYWIYLNPDNTFIVSGDKLSIESVLDLLGITNTEESQRLLLEAFRYHQYQEICDNGLYFASIDNGFFEPIMYQVSFYPIRAKKVFNIQCNTPEYVWQQLETYLAPKKLGGICHITEVDIDNICAETGYWSYLRKIEIP